MSATCDRIGASGTRCGKPATILDAKRMLVIGTQVPIYICLACARAAYPKLYPPPPQQLRLPRVDGKRWDPAQKRWVS